MFNKKEETKSQVTIEGAIDVYFLAAPQDEAMCKAIKKYLTPVVRNSKIPIELHSDFDIPPGSDIDEYKEKLYDSEIVLSFISVDYLDNNECHYRTQKVIKRYNNKQTILLPILVRNCLWKSTPFVDLPLIPENRQPLNNKQFWNSEDDALTLVASEIHQAISTFRLSEPVHEQKTRSHKVAGIESIERVGREDSHPDQQAVKAVPKIDRADINEPHVEIRSDWRKTYYKKAIWKRTKAFLLDNILTLFPIIILGAIIGDEIAFLIDLHIVAVEPLGVVDHIIVYGFPLLLYISICAFFESKKWRGTFGKIIMKLQTTDLEGNKISFSRAFWRNLLRLIFGNLWVFIIIDFYFFGESTNFKTPLILAILPMILQIIYFIKSKKLIHDQFSGTVVGEKLTS